MVSPSSVFLFLSLRRTSQLGLLLMGTLFAGGVFGDQSLPNNPITDTPNEQEAFPLYLEVILNQTSQPKLLPIIQRGQELFAQAADLRQLGFILDAAVTDVDSIALSSLPGLEVEYLINTQQLQLNAPLTLLSLPTIKLLAGASQTSPDATSSPGALVNYDLFLNQTGDSRQASAATELRVFGFGNGVFSNTSVTRAQRTKNTDWTSETVALDTFVEWSFPDNATRLIVGDSVSGGLDWTRSLRLGGVQFGRNFRLQPYRTTSPLASFVGKATLPSSVELYIDGMRRYQSEVPVGPFELNTMPGINGVGQAQVVTTDILGRTTTIDIPFYSTQQLLTEGLSDWSISLGAVHEDFGIRSFSYGDELVATGSVRYGVSNQLTMEGHAETAGNLLNGGIGAVWQPKLAGVISLAHTRSNENGVVGHQTAWRYNWSNSFFNFSTASQRTFGDYRDVATHYGTLPATISEQILAGVHAPSFGNFGASATRFDYTDDDERPSRYAGLYWSNSISNGAFLNLSYNQNLDDTEDRNLQFGINISFDNNYQSSSSVQRNADKNSYQTSLQRALPSDGGYGWRLQGGHNDESTNTSAEGSWQGDHGRIDVGVARSREQNTSYAEASGGLVLMNNQSFASRRIDDSFAVVSTNGISDVPVKLENRVIGHTNDRGNLLVTRLNAWQRNKLSIDPLDLPADNKVTVIDQIATPSNRAGTLVQFSIEKIRAAIVLLVDKDGQPLPVASQVRQQVPSDNPAFVGFDGQTYIENLQDQNRLQVNTPNGTCYAEFDYVVDENSSNYIGPIKCLENTSL